MTGISVYQRLAEDCGVRSIRSCAARRLRAFELALRDIENERHSVEAVMRHEASGDGRGTVDHAPSSVNATTVSASARVRVRDSHDARDAEERSTQRPYSEQHYRKDLAQRSRDDGTCVSVTVPLWALEAFDTGEAMRRMGQPAVAFTPTERETAADRKPSTRVGARTTLHTAGRLHAAMPAHVSATS